MPVIRRTPESREDIVEILLYIRRDRPSAALRVEQAIEDTLQLLAQFPGAGQERNELAASLRTLPVRRYHKYIIFYRPTDDGIEVIRVLHGARDLRRLFRHN